MRRYVTALGLVLALALTGAVGFTLTDRFRELTPTRLAILLDQTFRGEVTVERLAGSIWGHLELEGVAIRYDGTDVVRLPRLGLRYRLLPFLRGRLEVTAVELSEAELDL